MTANKKHNLAIVGTRQVRQGTGEFVAKAFVQHGCSIKGLVGTTTSSVDEACQTLKEKYGIQCKGYLDLIALLNEQEVDIVAICSPPDTHAHLLETAARFGCHVFCEKPLWWNDLLLSMPDTRITKKAVESMVALFNENGRYLEMNGQWPFTLIDFKRLHEGNYDSAQPVVSFSMWLSPISTGVQMIIDSAPHPLSMLYTLVGSGKIKDISIHCLGKDQSAECIRMEISFSYQHGSGITEVNLIFAQQAQPPRSAGYKINGFAAERHIELPAYLISFNDDSNSVSVSDPLSTSVKQFLNAVNLKRTPDLHRLSDGMIHLQQLANAAVNHL